MRALRRLLAGLLLPFLALGLAGCAGAGLEADPALYRLDRSTGSAEPAGWLFGTIHALPQGTRWQGEALDEAMDSAGVLVVEVRELRDAAAIGRTLAQLGRTDGLPPLIERVPAAERPRLAALFERAEVEPGRFRGIETWAAALALASALSAEAGLDSAAGTDLSLLDSFASREIIGLESATAQLSIFDRLSEEAQLALLATMIDQAEGEEDALLSAWLRGDVEALARQTEEGLGGNEELRNALLVDRNRRWVATIARLLEAGRRPLIAVGAGHVGGPDGLLALLEERGWTVTRVR